MTGFFAVSKAGHDKGKYYVVVGEEEDFVHLCDGRGRTMSNPKRKRRKHVQIAGKSVAPELLCRLKARERVQDEEIKYEIKQYMRSIS